MQKSSLTRRLADKRIQGAALLAGLLLLATALAGCTSAQATASQLQAQADERASDWDDEPELLLIVGTEGNIAMQSMMGAYGFEGADAPAVQEAAAQDFWDRVEDDPEPGDGKGELWLYVYRNAEGTNHLLVVVDRDRKIIYEDETDGTDLGYAVGTYNIDSDQAVTIAMEANEHLGDAMEADNFGFVIALMREAPQDNPFWIVAGGGGGPEGGGGGYVKLDAKSGDVLETQGGGGSPENWGP